MLTLLGMELSANRSTVSAQSVSVAIQPIFILNNAGKIDVELQPAKSRFGYILTAELYGGTIKDKPTFSIDENTPSDKLRGAGIGISQKYKFKDDRSSPYIAYGLTYRYQEIAIETEAFYAYQENGFTYYGYGPVNKNLVISSGMASAVFGYQKLEDDFVYDFYFGAGYKTQFKNTDFDGLRSYDRNQYSYAYKGPLMLVGLKIGFQFR